MHDLVASRRSTSNSRGPGQEGVVYHAAPKLTACPLCLRLRYGTGPHAPHYVQRDGRLVLVDCQNKEVRR